MLVKVEQPSLLHPNPLLPIRYGVGAGQIGDQPEFPSPGPGEVPGPCVLWAVGFDFAPA